MKFPIINIYVHFFFFLHSCKLTTFAHILNKKSMSFCCCCFELHRSRFKIWLGLCRGERATCESPVKLLTVVTTYTVTFPATWQLMINLGRTWAEALFFWRGQHVFWHFFGVWMRRFCFQADKNDCYFLQEKYLFLSVFFLCSFSCRL